MQPGAEMVLQYCFDSLTSREEMVSILRARLPVPLDPSTTLWEAVDALRAALPGKPWN